VIRLPMFSLGTVVFPYTAVPLRVFEPRYRALLETVEGGDGRFGIVLIERGFEVGGGDQRFDLGTMVEVVARSALEDGTEAIVVAGTDRIRVVEWLPDDPHPWAMVELLADEVAVPVPRIGEAAMLLERAVGLMSELGADVSGTDLSVSDDPLGASYQLSAMAPVLAIDHQRLLAAPAAADRVDLVIEMLTDQIDLLESRLGR
jgi:hypothetical protein